MNLSFQARLALFFSALLVAAQAFILFAVYGLSRANVMERLGQELAYDERILHAFLMEQGEGIASEARILVADFGFRAAASAADPETVRSALDNLNDRIRGHRALFVGLDGQVVADTAAQGRGAAFAYPAALVQAEEQGRATLFGFLDGVFHAWAVVPVRAPVTIGWVAIGLRIDQAYLGRFLDLAPPGLALSLIEPAAPHGYVLASSLPARARGELALWLGGPGGGEGSWPRRAELADQSYLVAARPLAGADRPVLAVLQLDLGSAMEPYTMLFYLVLGLSLFGLGAALLGGYALARQLARPVRDLASAGEGLMEGKLDAALPEGRGDELGRLAETFRRAGRMALEMGELKHKDRVRRELVAHVSHDLRSPLTSLRGYLEAMSAQAAPLTPEERERYLAVAVRQSEQLGKLAQELFELARLECDESSFQPEAFPLAELLQDVARKFELSARQRGVELRAGAGPELPWVRADLALVERVLTNLLDNALRHTPPGGQVWVEAEPGEGRVEVAVSDTGVGIAPEHLPRLFDWDSPLSRRGGGIAGGLGLILVGRIVALHGGTIRAESVPGRGSVFRFDLPRA